MPSGVFDTAPVGAFEHRTAAHSGAAAVRDVLQYDKLNYGKGPISAALVFGLGGALDFLFLPLPCQEATVLTVGGTSSWFERDIAAHLGLELELHRTDDPREGLEHVEAALRQGRLPVVWADFASPTPTAALGRTSHRAALVVSVDWRRRQAWIATHDRSGVYAIGLDDLAAARSVAAAPTPNRHAALVYRPLERLPPLGEAATRGIARTVQNMTAGARAFAGLQGGPGLAGIDSFAAAVRHLGAAGADRDEFAALVHCIAGPEGVAPARRLQAAFFAELADVLDDGAALQLSTAYERAANRWSELAAALTTQRTDSTPTLPELAEEVRLVEHRGTALMEAWVGPR